MAREIAQLLPLSLGHGVLQVGNLSSSWLDGSRPPIQRVDEGRAAALDTKRRASGFRGVAVTADRAGLPGYHGVLCQCRSFGGSRGWRWTQAQAPLVDADAR
jgi:hypothetical protein